MKNDDDEFLTLLVVAGAAVMFGPGLLAHFVPRFSDLLVRLHILVSNGILIPIGTGAGLDLPRTAIALGILVLLALLVIVVIRRASARRKAKA